MSVANPPTAAQRQRPAPVSTSSNPATPQGPVSVSSSSSSTSSRSSRAGAAHALRGAASSSSSSGASAASSENAEDKWQNPQNDMNMRLEGAQRIANIFKCGSNKSRDERREYKVLIALEHLCYKHAKSREEYADATQFEVLLHRIASEKAKRRSTGVSGNKQDEFTELLRLVSDGEQTATGGQAVTADDAAAAAAAAGLRDGHSAPRGSRRRAEQERQAHSDAFQQQQQQMEAATRLWHAAAAAAAPHEQQHPLHHHHQMHQQHAGHDEALFLARRNAFQQQQQHAGGAHYPASAPHLFSAAQPDMSHGFLERPRLFPHERPADPNWFPDAHPRGAWNPGTFHMNNPPPHHQGHIPPQAEMDGSLHGFPAGFPYNNAGSYPMASSSSAFVPQQNQAFSSDARRFADATAADFGAAVSNATPQSPETADSRKRRAHASGARGAAALNDEDDGPAADKLSAESGSGDKKARRPAAFFEH